jgi:glutamine synthetase
LSLWDSDRNLFADGLSAEGERFLAGILDQLPALVGVTAPSVASYLRMVPSHWAGVYRCWGVENREAAMRFIPGSAGPESANVEVKCIDPSANPYLAIGAVIALGLASDHETLPAPISGDPVNMPEAERLPQSLSGAMARLKDNTILRAAMGDRLFDAFLAVRSAELATFGELSAEEIVAATRWRY